MLSLMTLETQLLFILIFHKIRSCRHIYIWGGNTVKLQPPDFFSVYAPVRLDIRRGLPRLLKWGERMKLSEALGSKYVTDGDLNAVRTLLEQEAVVDIAGCMFTRKIAEKLSSSPNVTDSEDEAVRRIIEENIALPKVLSESPQIKLPFLYRPINEWLQSLQTGVIYDCGENYQHGILAQIARPDIALSFSYSTKHAFGLISNNLYAGGVVDEILSGSEYVLVPSSNAFIKYKYIVDGGQLNVERSGAFKIPQGVIEAKILPGYFGEKPLLRNKQWEPVMKACLAASELRSVKKSTLYSFLTGEDV